MRRMPNAFPPLVARTTSTSRQTRRQMGPYFERVAAIIDDERGFQLYIQFGDRKRAGNKNEYQCDCCAVLRRSVTRTQALTPASNLERKAARLDLGLT